MDGILGYCLWTVIGIFAFLIARMFIRFIYEFLASRDMVYMRVTLPKADSKLDKEKETKKDLKEKLGVMSVVYRGLHRMSSTSFFDTAEDVMFRCAKVSMELVYDDGEVYFYIITYKSNAKAVTQLITSNYPDAEVRFVDREKEYVHIKPAGYTLRMASVGKRHDSVLPIKTYKTLEDDLLSNFTNAFGGLKRGDKAVFLISAKPVGSKWNKKAKKAATDLAKGKFKKGYSTGMIGEFFERLFAPFYWILNRFVNNEETHGSNAP